MTFPTSDAWFIFLSILGSISFGLTAVILSLGVKNQNIFSGINIRTVASVPFLILLSLKVYGFEFYKPYLNFINFTLMVLISTLLISGDLLLMHILKTKPIGLISPLVAVTPLFTVLLLLFTGQANITPRILVLTIIIVFGIAIVTYNPHEDSVDFDLTAIKYGLTIAALWGFMLYFEVVLLIKDGTEGISFAAMKFSILGLIGLVLYQITLKNQNASKSQETHRNNNLHYLLLAGFVGWVLGSVLVYTALNKGPVAIITPIIGLNPLFAVLISLLMGREEISILKGFGIMLCVISSIFLIS